MLRSALAKGIAWPAANAGATLRGADAVVEIAEPALGGLADDRLHHRVGDDEARAHEIGDPGIALEPAEVPVQPVEILFGRQRRQQGLRAGVVVGIIERLHRNLQQDLVALRARAFGELGGIRAVGRKRQRHRRRQLHDGVGGLGRADAEAADDDGDDRHFRRLARGRLRRRRP